MINLSASSIRNFRQCQTLYFCSNVLRICPEIEPDYFRIGTAWHYLHEVFGAIKSLSQAKLAKTLDDMYADMPGHFDLRKAEIEKATLLTSYSAWRKYWAADEKRFKVLETEVPFEITVGDDICVRGKIDGLIMDTVDNTKWIREFKHTSEDIADESKFWGQFRMAVQPLLYDWAAEQFGWDVAGVQYDVFRKPTIRPTDIEMLDDDGIKIVLDAAGNRVLNKNGTPKQSADSKLGYVLQKRPMEPGEWCDKLAADIASRPERYFARREMCHTNKDKISLLKTFNNIVKQIKFIDENDAWDQNTDQCLQYGSCRFWNICSNRLDMTVDELPEGFTQRV